MTDTPIPEILVTQQELGEYLKLTTRWIYDLTKDGIFTKVGIKYPLVDSIEAFLKYKVGLEAAKAAPSPTTGLTQRKEELLKQRLDREARELISMSEALETVDIVTGAFIEVISGLPARITRNIGERKRIEAITDGVRGKLSERFSAEREALRTGVPVGEASDEDDT